ncbi:TorD/DmsD family molecular chaperone [Sporomusa acidovorans]|uniref:Chaperone protein TorD n=1 Tax=Sporomusa acidovorans (strain ATCC 49682 / DSM 3132 / Mol) TaxID=1123286 RepID=A0ABZ3J638_SPOA4|nr:molecular chaperone TorD family protein [Sporomusa acidovorans]OZC18567.1 chaperone protein TorD [Sporomusa acidovorans DSM 3132]SDE38575.1 chaperone TorD involved in molybdoenzyme TorA maturation [Sporomusa acidovorans]
MEKLVEYSAIMENRENLYRFLGRLYKVEVDQALLDQLEGLCFPVECGEDELAAGYRLLAGYCQQLTGDPLTDLAVDYARVFLGAGIAGNEAAYPYESVYTSPKRLIMQEARDQVMAAYRAKGLSKLETLDVPEDHIALELEFMAYLCQETQQALSRRDWPAVATCLKEQRDFFVQHLLNWVPAFCADIEKYGETKFYKAVAKITKGYLRLERTLMEELIEEIVVEVGA